MSRLYPPSSFVKSWAVSTLPSNSFWWRLWFAVVIGIPLVGLVAVLIDPNANGIGLAGAWIYGLGWLANIVVSIILAQKIGNQRPPESRTGAKIGLTIGLMFGGWAIMGAFGFAGCMALLVGMDHR